VRHALVLLLLAVSPLALAACSGADAKQAQDLLAQSRTAAQSVRSESFTMKVHMDAAGQSADVDAQGGMILKGDGAGNFYVTMATNTPGTAAPMNVVMVKKGHSVTMRTNGVTRTVPMPAGMKMNASSAAGFDLNAITPYVKDVTVSKVDVNGRTEDEVVGTIDGDALLSSMTGGGKSSVPDLGKNLLSALGASLGDIKVSLFIPRDSHLVETALLDMTMHVAKQSMHMSMSYAVTGVNQPVTFP
jgi:outer membrane lipoprotein-sorting protein